MKKTLMALAEMKKIYVEEYSDYEPLSKVFFQSLTFSLEEETLCFDVASIGWDSIKIC